jgi:general secretion pathway protein J
MGRVPHSALRIPHSKGFTLLEVLLAMAILAFIAAVIYGSFATAIRSVEQAEAARDSTDLARTLFGRLTNDIANAWCKAGVTGAHFHGKKEEPEVNGTKVRMDSLSLTTLTNWRRPGTTETDLWAVGYFFRERPDGSGRVLMRKERRVLDVPSGQQAEEAEYEITDQVESLKIRYTSDGKTWLDDAGGATACFRPRAAELSLMLADGKAYQTLVDVKDVQIP